MNRNKSWLDPWIEKIRNFENSHLKMEWNCGITATPTLEDKIIQFRAFGYSCKTTQFRTCTKFGRYSNSLFFHG